MLRCENIDSKLCYHHHHFQQHGWYVIRSKSFFISFIFFIHIFHLIISKTSLSLKICYLRLGISPIHLYFSLFFLPTSKHPKHLWRTWIITMKTKRNTLLLYCLWYYSLFTEKIWTTLKWIKRKITRRRREFAWYNVTKIK